VTRLANIPELLKPVADRLKALPARVGRIVFNGLIRPRFIPNNMPSPEHENDYPGDGYYFAYGPCIGSTETPITGTQLRDLDALIADVNARSEDVLKTRSAIVSHSPISMRPVGSWSGYPRHQQVPQ
jgi:hypothetical protein